MLLSIVPGMSLGMSKEDLPQIRSLGEGLHTSFLPVTNFVSCEDTKLGINELLISSVLRNS